MYYNILLLYYSIRFCTTAYTVYYGPWKPTKFRNEGRPETLAFAFRKRHDSDRQEAFVGYPP